MAISNLPISQPSGSSIAHNLAENAAALLSGLPPNLEGEPLTDPNTEEGSPGGEEGSPGGSEVMLVPSNYKIKSFVQSSDKKMSSGPSFKGMDELMDIYRKDFDYEDYQTFKILVPLWYEALKNRSPEGQQERNKIRAEAMTLYKKSLYTDE